MKPFGVREFALVCIAVLLWAVTVVLPLNAQDVSSAPADAYQADAYPLDVAATWFDLQLQLVQQTPGFSPPVASRALGYSGVALYETVVPGMRGYQSLAGQLSELTALPQPAQAEYHWETAANSSLATITRLLFPTASDENQAQIDALYERWAQNARNTIQPAVFDRSERFGAEVAEAVFEWSKTDGGHEGYLTSFPADYIPRVGEGQWVSTPRLDGGEPQPALQPYWGENRSFVPASSIACQPQPHPAYSEAEESVFYAEAQEVYDTSINLTAEQAEIAQFWSDDPGRTSTPPGHTISILTQILQQEQASLAFAAEAYAKIGITLADAFIGCWNAKYQFSLVRPVTYIQQFMDADWMPLLNTPPFPEYPSGHSVQIGASSTVLASLFGEAYAFTDHTHEALGLSPRSFESFSQMANEAALSRLYGGIHYRSAIELGLEQGRCIGSSVGTLIFQTDV